MVKAQTAFNTVIVIVDYHWKTLKLRAQLAASNFGKGSPYRLGQVDLLETSSKEDPNRLDRDLK